MSATREIECVGCGARTLARVEPMYENFKRVGAEVICTSCGKKYNATAAPFAANDSKPQVFTEADKPDAVKVFADDERRKCCAWCAHLVLNPFYQRCGLTNREVESTDLCLQFTPKDEE